MNGKTVLVLAGSRFTADDPLLRQENVAAKALIPVAGRPMLDHVLGSLEKSGLFTSIRVAMDSRIPSTPGLASLEATGRAFRYAPARGPAETVRNILRELPEGQDLWVCTADHPMLSPAMLQDFHAGRAQKPADIHIGFTQLERVRQRYPDAARTRLRFRDGAYSGCNIFALRTPGADKGLILWQKLEKDRKNPRRIALSVGPLLLLRYTLGILTLAGALDALGRRAGCSAVPVLLDQPEAAIDVDKPGDLRLVRRIMGDA